MTSELTQTHNAPHIMEGSTIDNHSTVENWSWPFSLSSFAVFYLSLFFDPSTEFRLYRESQLLTHDEGNGKEERGKGSSRSCSKKQCDGYKDAWPYIFIYSPF